MFVFLNDCASQCQNKKESSYKIWCEMYKHNCYLTYFLSLGTVRAVVNDFNFKNVVSKIYVHHRSCTLHSFDCNWFKHILFKLICTWKIQIETIR